MSDEPDDQRDHELDDVDTAIGWESIKAQWPSNPWAEAAYGRLMDLERMLLHVCCVREARGQPAMDALGTELHQTPSERTDLAGVTVIG